MNSISKKLSRKQSLKVISRCLISEIDVTTLHTPSHQSAVSIANNLIGFFGRRNRVRREKQQADREQSVNERGVEQADSGSEHIDWFS